MSSFSTEFPFFKPAQNPNPGAPQARATSYPVSPTFQQQAPLHPKINNPFLISQNTEDPSFEGYYGVNKPLKQALFLGYRDNRAILAGTKLFILY